jgi:hypothetical protein
MTEAPWVELESDRWLRWTRDDLPGPVRLRFGLDPDTGETPLEEVRLEGRWTGETLRRIPLGQLTVIARAVHATPEWFPWLDGEAVDVMAPLHWPRPLRDLLDPDRPRSTRAPEPHEEPEYVLEQPPKRPYPDEFYEAVARAYRFATAAERAPARMLAKANGVPDTTINRWVRVARERGHLPPTMKGRP